MLKLDWEWECFVKKCGVPSFSLLHHNASWGLRWMSPHTVCHNGNFLHSSRVKDAENKSKRHSHSGDLVVEQCGFGSSPANLKT